MLVFGVLKKLHRRNRMQVAKLVQKKKRQASISYNIVTTKQKQPEKKKM